MHKAFVWITSFLLGIAVLPGIGESSRSGNGNQASASAAQTKKRITVPAGTRLLIRMVDSIETTKQTKGYRFTATLETNLQAEDTVVAPRGTTVYGRLAEASSAGSMSGSSGLTLELTDIVINGTAIPLLTSTYEITGRGEGGNTTKKVVGGAGLGAMIGGSRAEERGRPLARAQAVPQELRLLLRRRGNN